MTDFKEFIKKVLKESRKRYAIGFFLVFFHIPILFLYFLIPFEIRKGTEFFIIYLIAMIGLGFFALKEWYRLGFPETSPIYKMLTETPDEVTMIYASEGNKNGFGKILHYTIHMITKDNKDTIWFINKEEDVKKFLQLAKVSMEKTTVQGS